LARLLYQEAEAALVVTFGAKHAGVEECRQLYVDDLRRLGRKAEVDNLD
jgi:hypothetical protein